ncbi:MAG: Na/Pi cotransporter family protein [Opitutales bacterium]|nr:Na/Pi cotransporter family protein [Opitutales bacterium]
MLFLLLGGIGLFLLGMVLLTEGLKDFAGDRLRQALLRFTGKPVSAFLSGLGVTAMVQSSSATTLMTIGFVSAGLLTFPQSIGVIMGASLGTTSTGWIVSTLGLKFSIGTLALPLVGIGAFMKLLGRGRIAPIGVALAGFGLIFIGIDHLQEGMAGLAEAFDLSQVPSTGFWGHLLILLIGFAMTVIMQSSSAAVATAMAALHAGTINMEQATSLVIGQAIGTTVTAALACIGASVPARRTSLAHILFNLLTGVIALILLPIFLRIIAALESADLLESGAIALAFFHTSFIALGVLIFLPFVKPFARGIEWLLPHQGSAFSRHLDDSLLSIPSVALEAVWRSQRDTATALLQRWQSLLDPQRKTQMPAGTWKELEDSLESCKRFLARIPFVADNQRDADRRVSLLHSLDHMTRLVHQIQGGQLTLVSMLSDPVLAPFLNRSLNSARLAGEALHTPDELPDGLEKLEGLSRTQGQERKQRRHELLQETASGKNQPEGTLKQLDVIRLLDSSSYHIWRIAFYLISGEPVDSKGTHFTLDEYSNRSINHAHGSAPPPAG